MKADGSVEGSNFMNKSLAPSEKKSDQVIGALSEKHIAGNGKESSRKGVIDEKIANDKNSAADGVAACADYTSDVKM